MTPTNEPSTEGRTLGPMEEYVYLLQMETNNAAPRFVNVYDDICTKAREIDAEITTLTDALTEARAISEQYHHLYDTLFTNNGKLGAALTEAQAALREITAEFHHRQHGEARVWAECKVMPCPKAQSILKDAPKE